MTIGAQWADPVANIGWRREPMVYSMMGVRLARNILRDLPFTLEQMAAKDVLDYGCGTGRVARPLSFFFRSVTGYDPSPEAVMLAGAECRPVETMTFENLHYVSSVPTGTWDVVVCCHVLEHLTDEAECREAWRNICAALKPGGVMRIDYAPGKNQWLARLLRHPISKGIVAYCGGVPQR
jgi:2-polyprenyl-3-methyl-5-hydroxy-6-metoxy-1,4-benzoquinol methylase